MHLGVDFFEHRLQPDARRSAPGRSILSTEQDGKLGYRSAQAVNIFLQRPDINLAAAITALQSKRLLEILAEPNLLAISGQQASFLAGGEFPFPIVQPGAARASISIMWREYGIRLNFLPNVTPRGTIRLKVAPEVSSLDYTNSVTVQGADDSRALPRAACRRKSNWRAGRASSSPACSTTRRRESLSQGARASAPFRSWASSSRAKQVNRQQLGAAGDHHAGNGAADPGGTGGPRAEVPEALPADELRIPDVDVRAWTRRARSRSSRPSTACRSSNSRRKQGQPPPPAVLQTGSRCARAAGRRRRIRIRASPSAARSGRPVPASDPARWRCAYVSR